MAIMIQKGSFENRRTFATYLKDGMRTRTLSVGICRMLGTVAIACLQKA